MGQEDQADRDAQQQRGEIGGRPLHDASLRTIGGRLRWFDRILAPIALFVLVYLATLMLTGFVASRTGLRWSYWYFLIAAVAASAAAIYGPERGRWNLGLAVAPPVALRDFGIGIVMAAVLLAAADLLIILTTSLRHVRNDGFPWRELLVVFIPAAVNEELVFRGYVYQKLRQVHRWSAIIFISLLFASLHGGNAGITWLALANIFAAGILLALVYERYERLWAPIGLHLAWNLISGPLLGYNVSGFAAQSTIFRTVGSGPPMLTGGVFGVEGSIWTLVVVCAGSAWLGRSNMMRRRRVEAAESKEPS
jgi:membrane protease YdiL (CAAX protease family)